MLRIFMHFFVCLLVLQFFRLAVIYDLLPGLLHRGFGYLIMSFAACMMLSSNFKSIYRSNKSDLFGCNKLLFFYGFFILLNCYTCYIFRGQSGLVTLQAWAPFLVIYLYPIMRTWNLSLEEWHKLIVALFIYFIIGYILQYFFNKTMIMYMSSTWEKYLRDGRVRIYSEAILYIGTLFFWNKYLLVRKIIYLLLFVLGVILIFLTRFRLIILVLPIVLFCIYIKINGFSRKIVYLSIITFFTISVATRFPVVQEAIEEMSDRNEYGNLDNDDYARIICFDYFTKSHFKNDVEYFWGSGMPVLSVDAEKKEVHSTPSHYSRDISRLGAYSHIFTVDWGLLGLSWVAGIPFVLILILILLKVIWTKVPNDYLYLKGYCFFVLLIGIFNPMVYYHINIFFLAIILTILDLVKNRSIKQIK